MRIALLALLLLLTGCVAGPLEPGRQSLEAQRQAWLELTKDAMVTDSVYVLTDNGDVLPVLFHALPLTDTLLAKARELWSSDPRLTKMVDNWLDQGRIVVLVGFYARDLTNEDLTKNGRFRAYLKTAGGLKAPPKGSELLKPELVGDFFPIFNSWERVMAMSFEGLWSQDPVLVVQWPGGDRELRLSAVLGGTN